MYTIQINRPMPKTIACLLAAAMRVMLARCSYQAEVKVVQS